MIAWTSKIDLHRSSLHSFFYQKCTKRIPLPTTQNPPCLPTIPRQGTQHCLETAIHPLLQGKLVPLRGFHFLFSLNGSLEVYKKPPPIFPWKCHWFLFFCTKLPGSFGMPQRPALLGAILPMAGLPKETKVVAWSCFKPSNG